MKRYLKRFLAELPNQTYFHKLEIVLDHNEPDEEELGWVREFIDRYPGRIRHIVTNPVEPIGVSMNSCIRAAQGTYLTIWNVDDLRTSQSIEKQVEALERAPEAVVTCGEYEVVTTFGATAGKSVSNRNLPPTEHHRGMTLGPFFMFRAAVCEAAGLFDEQLRSGADFDFALRLLRLGPPVFSDGCLGYYLNEGLGASTRPNSLQKLEANVIYLRYGIWDKFDLTYLGEIYRYDVNNLLIEGRKVAVESFFRDYSGEMEQRRRLWFPNLERRYHLKPTGVRRLGAAFCTHLAKFVPPRR